MFKTPFIFLIAAASFSLPAQAIDPLKTNRFVWLHSSNGVEHELVFGSSQETIAAWHDNRDATISYEGGSYLPKFKEDSVNDRPSLQFGYDVNTTTGNTAAAPTYLQDVRSPALQSLAIFAVVRSDDTLYGPIFSGVSGSPAPWSFQFKGTNSLVWRQGTTISKAVPTQTSGWNIVELQRQGTGVRLGSNGVLANRQVFATTPPSGITTRIGGTITDYLTGNIAELLVYSKATGTALPPSDRVKVLKYLSGRYAIELKNQAPRVRVSSPVPGSIVAKGKFPLLKVAASDDGTITSVKYYVDGKTTPLIELKKPPFNYQWKTVKPGRHSVKAVAQDEFGKVTTSPTITFKQR